MPAGWFPPSPHDPDDPHGAPPRRSSSTRTQARERVDRDHGRPVLQVDVEGVWVAYPTLLERMESHLLGDRLDRTLAAGVRPECDVLLALRAERLACIRTRRELATSIQRLLGAAAEPPHAFGPNPSMAVTSRVNAARAELESLVDHLLAPVPVSARGVAQVRILLRDGSGPLYRYESRRNLGAMVRTIIDSLDPTRDWPD